jgi:hypothetical protein
VAVLKALFQISTIPVDIIVDKRALTGREPATMRGSTKCPFKRQKKYLLKSMAWKVNGQTGKKYSEIS